MRTEFILPFASPSRNQLDKLHWRKRYQLRVKYTNLIMTMVKAQKPGPIINHPGPVSILFTRQAPRPLDHDNFVGGLKLVQDAIKQAGLIVDDKPTIIVDPQYEQVKVHYTQARTIIIIEDFPISLDR